MGSEKVSGFIMKLSPQGLLFEIPKIKFPVGSILTITFNLKAGVVTEKVRSIKHYDRFFRKPPKGKLKPDELAKLAKQLIEFQFTLLNEVNRQIISKYLIDEAIVQMKKKKKL